MKPIFPALLLIPLVSLQAQAEEITFDCVAEPAQRVQVGSSVTGLLDSVSVGRGDRVRAGQELARLESKVEEANVALAAAQANARETLESQRTRLGLAEAALDRARQLVGSGSVTRSRVEELEAAVEITRRDVETEQHRLRLAAMELDRQQALLDRQSIVSPIDGFVLELTLREGEFVRQDSPIMTLVQTDPIHVEAYVPVELWGKITTQSRGEVLLDQPAGARFEAPVTVVDRVFDAASGTFGIRLELANTDNAVPAGQRCRVVFEIDSAASGTQADRPG